MVILLSLEMVPLRHTKSQLRELRYSSGVTQGLSQLGGWEQCVLQIRGGPLTLLIIGAHVRTIIEDSQTILPLHQLQWWRMVLFPVHACAGYVVSFVHLSVCQRKDYVSNRWFGCFCNVTVMVQALRVKLHGQPIPDTWILFFFCCCCCCFFLAS